MRGRSLIATSALLFVSSLACGMLGDGKAALKKQETFAERTCACANVACVTKVQQEQAKWMQDHGEDIAAAAVEDSKRFQAAVDKTAKCVERISREAAEGVTGSGSPGPGTKNRGGGGGKKGGKKKGKRKNR